MSLKLIPVIFATALFLTSGAFAQTSSLKPFSSYKLYPDEYSELDDVPTAVYTEDEYILETLENARQKYVQALIMIENGDTLLAAKYFERAIEIINELVSYPNIEDNRDFTELSYSVIEDYETMVPGTSFFDEDTPLFILHDRINRELENKAPIAGVQIEPIKREPDSIPSIDKYYAIKQDTFIIPMPINEYVEKNIEFFSKNELGRKYMEKWIARSKRWYPMMHRIMDEESMPHELVYLSMIESGLNPNAVSRAKAVGLWQFMRPTGLDYGLNAGNSPWIDERRDPEKATRAAMRHLRDLYYIFGDWHLALAAYNCGAGCVSRRIKMSGKDNPDFWDIRDYLPKETRWYVPKFIAAATIATNPEKYGFRIDTIQYDNELLYETYKIDEAINLNALAKCINISVDSLQLYNPELVRMSTPPDVKEYEFKIPQGKRQSFIANLALLTEQDKRPWVDHKVTRGQTLYGIARQYGTSASLIAEANKLRSYRSKLYIGQMLKIPVSPDAVELADGNTIASDADLYHYVRSGESLSSISGKYGISLSQLRDLNDISRWNDKIHVGQRLLVAKAVTKQSTTETTVSKLEKPKIVRHIVKSGETLAKIADMYDVNISSIQNLNRMSGTKIIIGQALKIQTSIEPKKSTPSIAKSSTGPVYHKVRRGETISTIASRYGVTDNELKSWNEGRIRGNTIFSGSTLKIYPSSTGKGGSYNSNSDVNVSPKYYTVRRGDTLYEIARKFGVSVSTIRSKNKNLNERYLRVGQKIRIQ